MKEITIVSGKGGAGKTSITAALASLASNAVFCDNDVDAADLHLIFKPEILETHPFSSGSVAEIDPEKCTQCGLCETSCRFDAIHTNKAQFPEVNPFQCEGCRLCERICPAEAISTHQKFNNHWFVSDTRFGKMIHAKMGPGEENSGHLVTHIREHAKSIAREIKAEFLLNDGPPGIGCAAIASVTGTDAVLLVIEPTVSGLHDATRLKELVNSFRIPMFAVINKYDINLEMTSTVEEFLKENHIQLLGKIPFDKKMVESMVHSQTMMEYAPDSASGKELQHVWEKLEETIR
ncbi:(4Fe-4S)-binding protein [Maribellus luteus]|uniref:(4Fe-4S)-binding protein n=1 Tax=Maribellus luteus TaxID=2305463 RepID=A0A399T058_9BACT|nr:ATP-binding protein [Maribellus luteus]RIJ48005.1 (4Fe-4S)-binding protein [Maribellus luteus]